MQSQTTAWELRTIDYTMSLGSLDLQQWPRLTHLLAAGRTASLSGPCWVYSKSHQAR